MASKSTTEKKTQANALLSKLQTTLGPETYTEFQKKLKAWRDGSLFPSHLAHYISTTFESGGKEKLLEEVGSFLPADVGEEVRSLQNKRKREERGTVMLGGWKGGGTPVKRAVGGFDPLFGLSAVKTSPRPKSLLVTPTKGPPKSICLKPESLPSSLPSSSPSSSTTSKTSSPSSKSPTLSSIITSPSSKVSSSSSEASSPSLKSSSTSSKATPSPSHSPSSKTSPASDRFKQTSSASKPKPAPAPTNPTPKPKPTPAPAPIPTPTPSPTFLPTLDLSPSLYLFDTPNPNPDPSSSSPDDDDDNDLANTIKCSFYLEEIDQATAPKCGHVGCPPCWAKEFGAKKVMHCPLCKKTIFCH